MRGATSLIGVALVAFVAGCVVGPDFAPPPKPKTQDYTPSGLPELIRPGKDPQQHFALGEMVSDEWWSLFRSTKLDDMLRQAIANNPSLAKARATLARAREAVTAAGGARYPQVDFGASAARLRTSLLSQGVNQLGPIVNDFTVGPTVSYALDLFGANQRLIEQQDALADYEDYVLDGAYIALTGNAVQRAIEIAAARDEIDSVQSLLRDDERNLELVSRQFALHYKTRLDVESARSQLASDRALLPSLSQRLSVARDALAILAGHAPGDAPPPEFDLAEFTLPKALPVAVPSELVHRRPDVLAAEAQLHAASAAVGIATAQLYPNITLSSQFIQESLSVGTLFDESASAWQVMAGLTTPIFHGGALAARKRGAVDAFDAAFANYRETVLRSFGQVADVLQALDHDAQLLAAQQDAIAAAQDALETARASFALARVELLRVLDAQRQLGRARLGYIEAAAQRYLDTAALFGAMGGGWQDWRGRQQTSVAPGAD